MTLTEAQLSRLTAALNNQLEADKQFAAKVKATPNDPASPTSSLEAQNGPVASADANQPLSPPLLAPAATLEPEKRIEAITPDTYSPNAKQMGDQVNASPAAMSPRSAASPPLVPQPFEDRYAKGWTDAWDFVRPQLHELNRRYVVTGRRLSSANRWVRWLPIICFLCTLFGFALGWCWGTILTGRPWSFAHKLEIIPKVTGDRGDKLMP